MAASKRGERADFRLTAADGASWVVKVASSDEAPESLAFQARALEHIASVDPELAVPRLRETLAGEAACSVIGEQGRSHTLRILSFLPGSPLYSRLRDLNRPLGAEDLMTLGAASGRLARALQGFHGSGAPRAMPWDLSNGLVLDDWLLTHIPASIYRPAKNLRPARKRKLVDEMRAAWRVSQRRACRVIALVAAVRPRPRRFHVCGRSRPQHQLPPPSCLLKNPRDIDFLPWCLAEIALRQWLALRKLNVIG